MDSNSARASRPKARQSLAHVPSRSDLSVDRTNATADISALSRKAEEKPQIHKKRTRGKSLGPGGIEALKETDGNALKAGNVSHIRSILKPTIPLTPPKNIPTFDELRKQGTGKGKSPGKTPGDELLIDFSTPGSSGNAKLVTDSTDSQALADPFSPVQNDGASEQTQSNIAKNDVEDEARRQAEKQAIMERRAARRRSMANRRVSFAPEATLHTWSVMELAEDSTTSSAANSTRRQSSMTGARSPAQKVDDDPTDPPSTPPKPVDEPAARASPVSQRDLHQKKRRRSSGLSAEELSEEDVCSSSPSGDVTTESSPMRVDDSMDSDSDTDGDTAMSMDETTSNTVGTDHSEASTQSSLDERLRQAASQAGTRGIDYDENGDDVSMDMADGTVTNAFQPWAQHQQDHSEASTMHDKENVNPFSPAQKARVLEAAKHNDHDEIDHTQGVAMDMTLAVGGIVDLEHSSPKSKRKSIATRRRSSMARRLSKGEESSYGDETMDMTTMAGGIILSRTDQAGDEEDQSDADMTMEFTTAVGGLQTNRGRRESLASSASEDDGAMDMTVAMGGILPPIEEQTEPQTDLEDNQTLAMDMTKAIGKIVGRESENTTQTQKQPKLTGDSSYPIVETAKTDAEQTPQQRTSIASETGSPSISLKPRVSNRNKSGYGSRSTTPKSARQAAPLGQPTVMPASTPPRQVTPQPAKAGTPDRTPVLVSVTHRSASPKKLFQAELKAKSSPASSKKDLNSKHNLLFSHDEGTGRHTPRVVLHASKPHQHLRRRSSGIGIDKEGFGSPKVSEILDRRTSIGDTVPSFNLGVDRKPHIRFEDPCELEQQVDAERAEEERRESGKFVMEQEANERQDENVTLQLKEMINSMSPRKGTQANRLKGRKSLAVGSASGVLGKRPIELDEDEDADGTPKRLKAVQREGSPVKKVHLPKPPTKEETTGRLTRLEQIALDAQAGGHTPIHASSLEGCSGLSPKPPARFREVSHGDRTSFEEKLDNVVGAVDAAAMHSEINDAEEKISLQQFLNMTNIHFIELSTTKRRHTIAQSLSAHNNPEQNQVSGSTESSFIAASTTMPLLEMYQHASRELKSYISTGRKIVRSIEVETLAEQPPLFREYIDARPDVKAVMDNQFRNGKTNARLQSKEGWYTWRSQLVDGLHGGLKGIKADLEQDLRMLTEQEMSLDGIVPQLSQKKLLLQEDLSALQQRLLQIESVDVEALKNSRQELQVVDQDLQQKKALLEQLQAQMRDKEEALLQAAELKSEMSAHIDEANQLLHENRGWPSKDVLALKAKADAITSQTGWSLVSAEEDAEEDVEEPNTFGVALTLLFQNSLSLFIYPTAYEVSINGGRRRSGRPSNLTPGPTAPISLTYAPTLNDDEHTPELPTEQRFFLQLIKGQLQNLSMMPKGSVSTQQLLRVVANGWNTAQSVSREIRFLAMIGITRVSIKSDESLSVKLMLMTADKSRVDMEFLLSVAMLADGQVSTSSSVRAMAIYGSALTLLDASKMRKVQNALGKEIESKILGEGAWLGAIHGFQAWLLSQTQTKSTDSLLQPKSGSVDEQAADDVVVTTGPTKPTSVRRSPLAAKKTSTIQRKALPVPSVNNKFTSSIPQPQVHVKPQTPSKIVANMERPIRELNRDKENLAPSLESPNEDANRSREGNEISYEKRWLYGQTGRGPAITPAMQEAMMQNTPVKRVGALRRSPI